MVHNLIPVLIFKYRDDMNTYFFPEAVEATKDDYWDENSKIVMCKTDKNTAEAEESNVIGLKIDLLVNKKYQE